jgi:hypothetical protein
MLKRFKIIADRYRNRRRRFGLRFFLIAAIYNKEPAMRLCKRSNGLRASTRLRVATVLAQCSILHVHRHSIEKHVDRRARASCDPGREGAWDFV